MTCRWFESSLPEGGAGRGEDQLDLLAAGPRGVVLETVITAAGGIEVPVLTVPINRALPSTVAINGALASFVVCSGSRGGRRSGCERPSRRTITERVTTLRTANKIDTLTLIAGGVAHSGHASDSQDLFTNSKNCPTCPVENLGFDQVRAFISALNQLSRKGNGEPKLAPW